ncbi:glycosyltransferase family 2 protein [Cupriavidus plantarum]|uniref:glycosyltransferase family 2 protein n=1 Tax=Cupriavidus plantarum TaxID=942865 RepID=UPI00339D575E
MRVISARRQQQHAAALHRSLPSSGSITPPTWEPVMTLISVVTINYNNRDGLQRTMDSVVQQHTDVCALQYVVIDGGSTDGSVELALGRAKEIDVFVSEPDDGIYAAMNKGLNRVTGEWVVFMNSGDCFAGPEALSTIARAAGEQGGTWVIYGDNISPRGLEPAAPLHRLRAGVIHACHQAMAFRVCDVRYNEKWRIYSDLDFVLQYYKRFKAKAFRHVAEPLSIIEESGLSARFPGAKRKEKFGIVYERFGLPGLMFAVAASVLAAVDLL